MQGVQEAEGVQGVQGTQGAQGLETQGPMGLPHALVVAQGLQGSLKRKKDVER